MYWIPASALTSSSSIPRDRWSGPRCPIRSIHCSLHFATFGQNPLRTVISRNGASIYELARHIGVVSRAITTITMVMILQCPRKWLEIRREESCTIINAAFLGWIFVNLDYLQRGLNHYPSPRNIWTLANGISERLTFKMLEVLQKWNESLTCSSASWAAQFASFPRFKIDTFSWLFCVNKNFVCELFHTR